MGIFEDETTQGLPQRAAATKLRIEQRYYTSSRMVEMLKSQPSQSGEITLTSF